jgi:ABC-type polysaccharide/polyol phosphate export permease
MSKNLEHVKYSKASILTSEEVYNRAYFEKLIFILTGATTYLVGVMCGDLLRVLINRIVKSDNKWYPVLLGFIIIFIILIAVNLFTFQKINTDKEEILKQVTAHTD